MQKDLFGHPIDDAAEMARALGKRQRPIIKALNDSGQFRFSVLELVECRVPFARDLVAYHSTFAAMHDRGFITTKVVSNSLPRGLVREWVRFWYPTKRGEAKLNKPLRKYFHPQSKARVCPGQLLVRMTYATFLHRKPWFNSFSFWLRHGKYKPHLETLLGGGYVDRNVENAQVTRAGKWD